MLGSQKAGKQKKLLDTDENRLTQVKISQLKICVYPTPAIASRSGEAGG
jgi:hypothetical protein